ncbi:hypothetical protein OB959_21515 [Aeromonas bestiarum]|uniref:Apea-like HEPN domain-containing protein n=1 Tax=Aeromonas bestiarum TaxID=105751 RepID=A0AAW7I287_9GAMM|nr:hypothetical protein [Aeromonas bestiarum]MDM5142344.1 hypothetical protein [Aeromonas bestiarum]
MWFNKSKKKESKRDEIYLSLKSWRELPGFSEPSIEDLKVEAINFERTVRMYLEKKGHSLNRRSSLNEMIGLLPNYPFHPDCLKVWTERIKEYNALRNYRNKLIHHRDCETLPSVKELYDRFKKANETLRTWRFCNSSDSRFSFRGWNDNKELDFSIDNIKFNLKVEDISNLMLQLDLHSRGKVNFEKGLMVVAKYHDYFYENLTVYIDGYPRFDLNADETMALSESLSSFLGERLYS